MKSQKLHYILLILLGFTIWGCKKRGDDLVQTATVKITVNYPATYSTAAAANTEVKLTSKGTGSSISAFTNSTGVATFQDVVPGSYDVAVTKSLTATESQALTGVAQGLVLNAVKTDVQIAAPQSPDLTLQLSGSAVGSLLIKEVYYTGSRTAAGGTYFSDQF
ncbi:MAG: carboxypeptidase-like regulatory domain-containing protein, partial [Bacteroidia bacterium]